jgi:Tol biopolymer transport system component
MMPTFSPDAHWIAYVSPQSDRNEVYVRSSSGEGRTRQISNNGGVEPVWSSDGRELFYREDDRMMVVDVDLSTAISFGKPRVLFEGQYIFSTTEAQEYDLTGHDPRFLMLKPQLNRVAAPITVVINWVEDLKAKTAMSR